MKTLYVALVRKPVDLEDLRYRTMSGGIQRERVRITETVTMNGAEYDVFTSYFCESREWLAEKGGLDNCLLVKAPGRPALVIDTQGYDYARYVALA